MNTNVPERAARSLHPALAEVALIDAQSCADVGAMSLSWWHEEVRTCRAPAPAIRQARFTRWRLVDVAAFWAAFAEKASANTQAGEMLIARAKRASAKAREPAAVAKAKATRVSIAAAVGAAQAQ